MTWERRIVHPGLNAFRVIRGTNPSDVDRKAEIQLRAWNEKWERGLQKRAATLNKAQKKQFAEARTRQAAEQLSALDRTLLDSLPRDHSVNWEWLKDTSLFLPSEPIKPTAPQLPPRPQRGDERFKPEIKLIDKLFSSRRRKRVAESLALFEMAEAQWGREVSDINASDQAKKKQFASALEEWQKERTDFVQKQILYNAGIDKRKEEYEARIPSAIVEYCYLVLENSEYPDYFPRSCLLEYHQEPKTLVAEYALPAVTSLPTLKEVKYVAAKDAFSEAHASESWLHRTYDDLLYKIALRTVYELFQADTAKAINVVVFNGLVTATDKATGKEFTACVLSVQISKSEFIEINLAQADPKACFKKLKGISASRLADLAPVRPILQINREDKRFVESYAVVDSLDDSSNLAAMDWEDFENLIREVFEKEFNRNGGEVKITQASRDGGVDAVAFDPDPIRGGKIVIQAKRYTNTVSVSAVRDLFGTVLNEGANKGILVTTADYGPDAYEFAKDKPLTLLNGSELLYLLEKHGHRAKINLNEARKLLGEKER
jgi:restriction system protein